MEEIAMKLASALLAASAFLLLHTALLSPAAAAEQTAPEKTSEATYDCKTSKAKVTTCKRPISQELKSSAGGNARPPGASKFAAAVARNATGRPRRAGDGNMRSANQKGRLRINFFGKTMRSWPFC
jgi:hypothetical protein